MGMSHPPPMMWWGGLRRAMRNAQPPVGLTADPEPEPPQAEDRARDLAGAWRNFRDSVKGTFVALGRVLKLVWVASPALSIGLAASTILLGAVPAASAWTTKQLINGVVAAILVHQRHLPDQGRLELGPIAGPALTTIGVIVGYAVIQLLIFTLQSLLNTTRNVAQQLLQERVTRSIQLLIMDKAAELDLAFFEDSTSYDLLQQAQQGAQGRPLAMISTSFGLIQTAITFATMVALLFGVSPLLAAIALVMPVPAFIADTRYGWRGFMIARWSSPLLRRMNYLVTLLTTDKFAKEIKLFGLGRFFIERYGTLSQAYYERQRRQVVNRYWIGWALGLLSTLANSATYLYVALQAVVSRLTLGDLTLYTTAAQSVQGSVGGILQGFSGMYENNLYLNQVFTLLEIQPKLLSPVEPAKVPEPLRGEIRFENVSFAYPGSDNLALDGVSFTVKPGETLAVVGRNGAGKTTLFKLICRLYDPTAGRITLDGVDLRDYDPDELRRTVGAMFQDFATYQATAAENVGLGEVPRLHDRHAVEKAAHEGGADELIRGLPMGYDTALGKWFDRGVELSGGEWQKIALGRAFMRDARVLLLDEPTSALDAQAEYDLFGRLRTLTKGRTAVYISHRFSTVRRADRILFLEHGRLVEEGTHQELIKLDGRYARLFRMQASAYTGEELDLHVDGVEKVARPIVGEDGGGTQDRSAARRIRK